MKHDEKQKCEAEYCRVQMMNNGWPSGCCGKPAKGISSDGKTPMCGVHLSGERRREQNANKGAEERRREIAFAEEVRALLEPLSISGHATGYRHRQLICSFDDLVKAFNKMCNCENCDAMYCTVKISSLHLKQDFYKKKKCIDENRNKWSEKHD